MHIVPAIRPRFHLVCDDGSRYGPYSSLEALVRAIHISVVYALYDGSPNDNPGPLRRFMVVSDDGDVVPVSRVLDVRRSIVPRKRSSFAGKIEGCDYVFRHGCVPGVHKRSGRGSFRRPKTTAERRAAAGHAVDERPAVVRSRRNHRVLIHAWDDIHRSSERSWKRHRKTQWH